MNTNKILLVLIFISFIVLSFALKNRADFISENKKQKEIENNISSISTYREDAADYHSNSLKSKTYEVKKGDTLWDIAEKEYGSGFKYVEIIKKNPGKTFKFKDGREGLIFEGTSLIL